MDKLDNSIYTSDGLEIYTDKIFYYSDEYISLYCDDIKELNFNDMILYIFDNIKPIDTNNIKVIENIFNCYYRLCIKYNRLPTLEMFSNLLGVNSSLLSKWNSGVVKSKSQEYVQSIKGMRDTCKNALIDHLNNSSGSNVNQIFIAKANYGLTEIAPVSMEYLDKKYKSADQLPDFRQFAQQKEIPETTDS